MSRRTVTLTAVGGSLLNAALFAGVLAVSPATATVTTDAEPSDETGGKPHPSCAVKTHLNVTPWSLTKSINYVQTNAHGMWLEKVKTRWHITLLYVDCTRMKGSGRHGILPREVDYCWVFPGEEEHETYLGSEFDIKVWDSSGKIVNPRPIAVSDVGANHNCTTRRIPNDQTSWLTMNKKPRWRAEALPERVGLVDTWFDFQTDAGATKPITPSDDPWVW